jgi:hypothetical protein
MEAEMKLIAVRKLNLMIIYRREIRGLWSKVRD